MNRPFVTLKLATSLDGRIALANGQSKWITGPEARAFGHRLRAMHDAILVGAGTLRADDPELTARTDPPALRQPLRAVADSTLSAGLASRLLATAGRSPVLLVHAPDAPGARVAALAQAGARLATAPRAVSGGLDPHGLLAALSSHGAGSVLLEGGGRLAGSFLSAGLVDAIEWFRAPIIIGGDGAPGVAALGLSALADAARWRTTALEAVGDDVRQRLEPV